MVLGAGAVICTSWKVIPGGVYLGRYPEGHDTLLLIMTRFFVPVLFCVIVPHGMAGGTGTSAPTHKSEARLRQLLIGGELFLGSALSASLTKMTLRAMDLLGESSPATKEMQVRTPSCCGYSGILV